MAEYQQWLDRWRRLGEILVSVSIVAAFTWLAALSTGPKHSSFHLWAPLGVCLGMLGVGIYLWLGPDFGWPLPQRKRWDKFLASDVHRDALDAATKRGDAMLTQQALQTIAKSLGDIAEAVKGRR